MKVTTERLIPISIGCAPRLKTIPTILSWYSPSGVSVISSPTQNKAWPSGLLTRLSANPHLPLEFSGEPPHTKEVFQSSIVNVMPNQKSVTVLPRLIVAAIGCASLLLGAVGTARADDVSSDDLFSIIFSTYGITVVLLLVLVGLIVFKKTRAKKEAAEFEAAKSPNRTSRSAANSAAPTITSPREPIMADERRTRVEAVQQWENPQPASEASVYGAYRIDQEG